MNYLSYDEKLSSLAEMIEKGRLDMAQQAAEKFECSKRTIRRMINTLREQGFPVRYNKQDGKYFMEK